MNKNFPDGNPYLSDSDVFLMLEARSGNAAAFESLMRKYYKRILNFIYRYVHDASEAEDLTQEVFIRVYRGAARYQPQAKFQTWIYTIARNTALNALRRHRGRTVSLDEGMVGEDGEIPRQIADPATPLPSEDLRQKELAQAVNAAIDSLPENQKAAILLRRYEDLSYEDIAAVLGSTVSAVKSLLSRARETLQQSLKGTLFQP